MNTTKQHEMIKLTHDFMFKAIFGKESNKELLAYIINKYLKLNINENNIEVNRNLDKTKLIRNETYALDNFSHQLTTVDSYNNAQKVIQINLNLKSIIKNPKLVYHLKDQYGRKYNRLYK